MRTNNFHQLLAVVGGLGVAVASTSVLAKPDNKPANDIVVPLSWNAGTATVDGDYSEWDLSADAATTMCTAGSIDATGNCSGSGKVHLSTLYARYDCNTDTMYVLVLEAGDYEAEQTAGDAWVTIGGNSNKVVKGSSDNDGSPPDFAWVTVDGDFQGYEASFTLAEGSYENVQIHLNVSSNTASTGKNGYTRSIVVPASCDVPDNISNIASMSCNDLKSANGAPMSLVAEYMWSGNAYTFADGMDIISITDASATAGAWSVDGDIIKVGAVIMQESSGESQVDQDGNKQFSGSNIASLQFCQRGVLDAGDEVCLWSANKDADGEYIDIKQEKCITTKQGKFYAIEVDGQFSNAVKAK